MSEEEKDEIEEIKKASDKQNLGKGLKNRIPGLTGDTGLRKTGGKLAGVFLDRKALPVYLFLAALYISSFRSANFLFREGLLNEEILAGKLQVFVSFVNSSFVLGSPIRLATTVLVLGGIWSIYLFWLKDLELLDKTAGILRKIMFVVAAVVILYRHVSQASMLGQLSQWIVFVLVLYLELAVTWFAVKTLDHVDLSSDLKNWSLRLLGLPTVFLGSLISIGANPFFTLTYTSEIYANNVFLAGILVMILGGFMIYRSTRRQPALKIW